MYRYYSLTDIGGGSQGGRGGCGDPRVPGCSAPAGFPHSPPLTFKTTYFGLDAISPNVGAGGGGSGATGGEVKEF